MLITRQVLAKQLSEYLHHNVTIEQLVDWAERAIMEGDFDPVDHDTLRDTFNQHDGSGCFGVLPPFETSSAPGSCSLRK